MGLLFTKSVGAFFADPVSKTINRRILLKEDRFLERIDLTYRSAEASSKSVYPYLEDLSIVSQLLPVPQFLLLPLKKYALPYDRAETDAAKFGGRRTVIYLHGSGSMSEDNSILQRKLLQNECDLVRISYKIDYKQEGVLYPQKATEMLRFLTETEEKIAPAINAELISALNRLKEDDPELFLNKEVILIAHSLGGGLAANLIASYDGIKFDKYINLDGTLMNPAVQTGLNVRQLHLSQDYLFKKEWIDAENFTDSRMAIGQDYCKKIDLLIKNSKNKSTWIQVKDSSHFTFTDFPDLLNPYKIFKSFVGVRESADRIRNYVLNFILEPDALQVDPKDAIICKR